MLFTLRMYRLLMWITYCSDPSWKRSKANSFRFYVVYYTTHLQCLSTVHFTTQSCPRSYLLWWTSPSVSALWRHLFHICLHLHSRTEVLYLTYLSQHLISKACHCCLYFIIMKAEKTEQQLETMMSATVTPFPEIAVMTGVVCSSSMSWNNMFFACFNSTLDPNGHMDSPPSLSTPFLLL